MPINAELLTRAGINTETRSIRLFGEVSQKMLSRLVMGYAILNEQGSDPIELLINTTGGDDGAALAMFDHIRLWECPSYAIVIGECFSAGTLIVQACDKRFMTENSLMMFHFGSGEYSNAADIAQIKAKDQLWNALIAERTAQPLKVVVGWHRSDTFMTAKMCITRNLIDAIIPNKKAA